METMTARKMTDGELEYLKESLKRDMLDESPSAPYYYQERQSDLCTINYELYRRSQIN